MIKLEGLLATQKNRSLKNLCLSKEPGDRKKTKKQNLQRIRRKIRPIRRNNKSLNLKKNLKLAKKEEHRKRMMNRSRLRIRKMRHQSRQRVKHNLKVKLILRKKMRNNWKSLFLRAQSLSTNISQSQLNTRSTVTGIALTLPLSTNLTSKPTITNSTLSSFYSIKPPPMSFLSLLDGAELASKASIARMSTSQGMPQSRITIKSLMKRRRLTRK